MLRDWIYLSSYVVFVLVDWGTFEYYANSDGVDPSQACCLCGKSVDKPQCDDDEEWTDVNGKDCSFYENLMLCFDGGYGPQWRPEFGSFKDYANADGIDATQACCQCKPKEGQVVTPPDTEDQCLSDPTFMDRYNLTW